MTQKYNTLLAMTQKHSETFEAARRRDEEMEAGQKFWSAGWDAAINLNKKG